MMKRIIRDRRLTPEEVAKYRKIREQIAEELPDLIARHHKRMAEKELQPREGQTRHLPKSANKDSRTTHVAIHKEAGIKYFCRFDPTVVHGQKGIPDDQVKGTYWITPCHLYGSCYNDCSLWQGGFDFVPIEQWPEDGKR